MDDLLSLQNLCKYYDTNRGQLHAVDGLSISIAPNTTLGVVGESGCGKSTLGRTIIGLTDATSGRIIFDGEDITRRSGRKRKLICGKMQMIFQDPSSSLDPRMTVRDLIAEPLTILDRSVRKREVYERVSQIMDAVGLDQRVAGSYPHELDGGRRQRIGIARALIVEPKFIVCDEPVSALDVSIQAQIINLLQDLQKDRGLTYIFITHDLSVVKHISDFILVMYMGCQVEYADKKSLFLSPLHPYTKGLLSAIPIPSIHVERNEIGLQGEISSPLNPKPGCRFAPRCPYADEICRRETPFSEEILPGHFCACHHVREVNGLS